MMKRSSGILAHISSLKSGFGVGDLGASAYYFADFLVRTGQTYWQMLPVNPPTGISDHCPYSAVSAFAGDTIFISPKLLHSSGLLEKEDFDNPPDSPSGRVDFSRIEKFKQRLLKKAYKNFIKEKNEAFEEFCSKHTDWLDDFALYMVLRDKYNTGAWNRWPKEIAFRDSEAIKKVQQDYAADILYQKFCQYIFFDQWHSLKSYCNSKGLRIIGDIPIYLAYDSADVWVNRDFFKLSKTGKPLFVAGTPPDIFLKTGQLWGNPVYNWKALKKTDYKWWVDRIGHNLEMFDIARLDHFRGMIAFWQVPAANKTAKKGRWVRTPKDSFFNKIFHNFSSDSFIVEDLGETTPAVRNAVAKYDLRGMKILQWATGSDESPNDQDLENHIKHCVAYTGTHDNNTLIGWLKTEASQSQKENLFKAVHAKPNDKDVHFKLIEYLMTSPAELVIIPMQDVLGLGSDCRMNIPGTVGGNWQWQMTASRIKPSVSRRLKIITEKTNRSPN